MRFAVKLAANVIVFEAIGTHWEVESYLTEDQHNDVRAIIETYDTEFSRFRPDSLVTRMSREAGAYSFKYGKDLFKLYDSMYQYTNGQVTPLIARTLETMGYDATYSLRSVSSLYKPPAIEDVLIYRGNTIVLRQSALLDFGAAGKGHLVDIVCEYIERHTQAEYTVDAGGDIYSTTAQRIGLEHPVHPQQVIGYADIKNQSICGSSGSRRAWGEYHHIINPQTLEPVSNIVATWVIADTALLADGLATCLFFVEPEYIAQYHAYEYVMVMQDGSARISNNFPGKLFK